MKKFIIAVACSVAISSASYTFAQCPGGVCSDGYCGGYYAASVACQNGYCGGLNEYKPAEKKTAACAPCAQNYYYSNDCGCCNRPLLRIITAPFRLFGCR